MDRIERAKIFYSIIVSICWMHLRPITLTDISEILKMTPKQIRNELLGLENRGRIAKVPLRKKDSGRICAAWVIADNVALPMAIRNVCQFCGVGEATESYGEDRMCHPCFMGVEHDGRRIQVSADSEMELSLQYATCEGFTAEYVID